MTRRRRRQLSQLFLHVVVLLAAAIFLFPFFWMVSASFKPATEIFEPGINLLPSRVTFEHYRTALTDAPILRFLLNGVIVTMLILIGQLLVIVPAGYAFARLRFRGRDALFTLVLASLVVPPYMVAIPNFLLLSELKLLNSYSALVLPFIGSAFGIFLMRQFFLQLPTEVIDASRIDGCNSLQLGWYILLPLTRPALAAFSVFSIVAHWNDLFWPLVAVRDLTLYTPPAGIAYFRDAQGGGSSWGVVMAAAVLIITPLMLMFVAARRQFIESLAHSAVKG
jgi:multiple sugar transport system permease protein